MDLGKKIKVLRAQKGISQQQLADKINKTRALISHIELTSKVNYYTLTEIAKALNVSISYFDNQDRKTNVANESEGSYSNFSIRIEQLEKENALLTEIVKNQKELIEQLKKKQ